MPYLLLLIAYFVTGAAITLVAALVERGARPGPMTLFGWPLLVLSALIAVVLMLVGKGEE